MDQENETEQLAHDWVRANRNDPHGLPLAESARFEDAAVTAVSRQATDFVPDTAIRTVVRRDGAEPMIAGLEVADRRLTLVGAKKRNEDEAVGHYICVFLDPKLAVVEASSSWDRNFGQTWRTTRWKFDVHPRIAPLEFVSEWCLTNDPPDEERFAQALCEVLGWELPEPAQQVFPQFT